MKMLGYKIKVINNYIKNSVRSNSLALTFGLTRVESTILRFVRFSKKSVTPKDIGEEFSINKSTTSEVLKSLEQKGYIKKVQKEEDYRSIYIEITQSGIEIDNKYLELFKEIDDKILDCLTEEEIEQLQFLLEKVANNVIRREEDEKKES